MQAVVNHGFVTSPGEGMIQILHINEAFSIILILAGHTVKHEFPHKCHTAGQLLMHSVSIQ